MRGACALKCARDKGKIGVSALGFRFPPGPVMWKPERGIAEAEARGGVATPRPYQFWQGGAVGSALGSYPGGRRFKSCPCNQFTNRPTLGRPQGASTPCDTGPFLKPTPPTSLSLLAAPTHARVRHHKAKPSMKGKETGLQVRVVPVAKLVPYQGNPRTHPDWQVAQIAASIAEFGFVSPILVGPDSVIIAGHGRLMAAQQLGLAEVPVIELGHLTEVQRRALVIADNRIAENAGWDEDLLRAELAALQVEGFELDVLGFGDEDLAALLEEAEGDVSLPAALGDQDFVPEPPPLPVSRSGDVWLLGPHRVMCGDSTSAAEVGALCAGQVDACWTDPPYNVNYQGAAGSIANDNLAENDFRQFLTRAMKAAAAVMKPGAPIYVAHADTEGLAFREAFRAAGFKLSGCLVWVKPSLVLGRSDYQWRHEPILYGWKPGAAHIWYGGRKQTTVRETGVVPLRIMPDGKVQVDVANRTFVVSGQNLTVEAYDGSVIRVEKPARNAEHPTMKPVALILEMLENSTRRGDRVLDLFGGSGSTLIACHRSGRVARLMELDPRFCDVIVDRWQVFTGQVATAETCGETFEQVRVARCLGQK